MSILDMQFENEEAKRDVQETLQRFRAVALERRQAALEAGPALERLAAVMQNRSGQCYKVRELLFSLWDGKPAELLEIVNLDWLIRKDLTKVMLAFGYEDSVAKCVDKCRAYVKAHDSNARERKL